MEGKFNIRQSREFENADDSRSYTLTDKWDLKLISQSYYGVVKVS